MRSNAQWVYLPWFLVLAASAAPAQSPPAPITGSERLEWLVNSTVGPQSLAAGLITSGWGTSRNEPPEYGPHWEGYGKRYGIRLTGIATNRTIEAGLGALWGEDPRYPRAGAGPFKGRVHNIFKMTLMARQSDGSVRPAYARYSASVGGSFLSNTWRADSAAGTGDAAMRIVNGFLGRLAKNAFAEFWPDLKHRFRREPRTP